jgi:ubiquinone/menaquinone biosynthesis C-methylase UbiE
MTRRTLTREQAKGFYDRFGKMQDLQRFYEDPAIELLLRYAELESASAVVELGCGTGRLAARLLDGHLPATATYSGFDISETMVELARSRVARWPGRAKVELVDGASRLPLGDDVCDRFLSTYVLDLLSEDDIHAALADARRVLAPGGRLCLASLTFGKTLSSRVVCRLWNSVHSLSPGLVGGCRPLDLRAIVAPDWRILGREVVCTLGMCTEVLVAE